MNSKLLALKSKQCLKLDNCISLASDSNDFSDIPNTESPVQTNNIKIIKQWITLDGTVELDPQTNRILNQLYSEYQQQLTGEVVVTSLPYKMEPPTHMIDMDQYTIQTLGLTDSYYPISIMIDGSYYINYKPVEPQLQRYIENQMNKNTKFGICLSKISVKFTDQGQARIVYLNTKQVLDIQLKYVIVKCPKLSHVELIRLPLTSYKATQVSNLFYQSQPPSCVIHQITKVNNTILKEKFKQEAKYLKMNLTSETSKNKRLLWHGVKSTHPENLYNSQKEGFDITYCQKGVWGTGIYFADSAKYSDKYAYVLPDGQFQGCKVMLLCKVLLGNSYTSGPNSRLMRPPSGYDSVSAYSNHSDIYVLYGMDLRRAYIAYEVIYS